MAFCFGRNPKDAAYCAALPQMVDYAGYLPDPLPEWSNIDLVGQQLRETPKTLFPIDGNDQIGNCTCAGASHAVTVFNGLIGKRVVPNDKAVIDLYHQLGGRGMSGLQLTTVTKAWQRGLFGGERIVADMIIDAGNHRAVKQAIQYFGGCYIGFWCNSETVPEFQRGLPWEAEGGYRQGGHCVYVTDYDADGIACLTWGAVQRGTWGWWDECVDEVHVLVTAQQALFDGTTMDNLKQAMRSLGA